ncbi:BcpB protein [Pseudovibrio sp. FO-BEG1]|uniref:peroxiredoxin n=1 Tax=Pseudovibrio sp. (strain FO-BEG1) TaxID=911045 RepID=UPI000238C8E9|nr:peroxiredoxin [Pseudovibrio sp. FO-BEG1]AEV39078.1 BcpB protein [Pseudovibrio sp. FO-BEG1]
MTESDTKSLLGVSLPQLALRATSGEMVDVSALPGITVIYAYPRTSPPDEGPIEGWDLIPGARGCTPQSCAFRDHFSELKDAGAQAVFGLSTQSTVFQREAAERLHLPFALLSDEDLALTKAMELPTFEAGGMVLLKRLTMILKDGVVEHIMYPVSDPAKNAEDVIAYLKQAE